MRRIFTPDSPYKKQARFLAVLWTLLVFIGCLTPGKELPKVDVPFIDKWTHLVLFGVFTFLWLCAFPSVKKQSLMLFLFLSVLFGAIIEFLQGWLVSLGRSMELMDAVADSIGGMLGIILFCTCAYFASSRAS